MDVQVRGKHFIVCGATSGFGKAIVLQLVEEGAHVIAIARGKEKLEELQNLYPSQIEIVHGDITKLATIDALQQFIEHRTIEGVVINAGGPPAKMVQETTMDDWDNAYETILKWKVVITQMLLPKMIEKNYGKFVFIESSSVKQPIENLVLSTSLRLAVVGFAKTLAQEVAKHNITVNVLAPGSHDTPAIERLYHKKVEQTGLDFETVKATAVQQIPVQQLGQAADFASLAVWLLSPLSKFVTGQTFAVEGGAVKSTL
jgi:3-oxoacyl-[acyl-carrier protein] reductase